MKERDQIQEELKSNQQKYDELFKINSILETTKEDLNEKIAQLESKISSLTENDNQIDNLKARISILETENTSFKNEIEEFRTRSNELEKKLLLSIEANSSMKIAYNDEIESLYSELKSAQEKALHTFSSNKKSNDDSNLELEKLSEQLAESQRSDELKKREIERLNMELEALKNKLSLDNSNTLNEIAIIRKEYEEKNKSTIKLLEEAIKENKKLKMNS